MSIANGVYKPLSAWTDTSKLAKAAYIQAENWDVVSAQLKNNNWVLVPPTTKDPSKNLAKFESNQALTTELWTGNAAASPKKFPTALSRGGKVVARGPSPPKTSPS